MFLKKWLLGGLRMLLPMFSHERWRAWSGRGLVMPFYHAVEDEPSAHLRHLYAVRGVRLFEADLDWFSKQYTFVSVADLVAAEAGERRLPPNALCLSFDDGLRSCAEVIAPILKQRGIPAAFFLNPPFLDNKALMYRYTASLLVDRCRRLSPTSLESLRLEFCAQAPALAMWILERPYADRTRLEELAERLQIDLQAYLREERPYLTTAQAQQLAADGFALGSHSLDHPRYAHIPLAEQIRQTTESQQIIDKKFAPDHRIFAFPFSDSGVEAAFFEAVRPVLDLSFGTAGIKPSNHPRHLQRLPMESDRLRPAAQIVHTEYAYDGLRRRFWTKK